MWGLPGTAGLSLEVRQGRLGGPSCDGEGSLKSLAPSHVASIPSGTPPLRLTLTPSQPWWPHRWHHQFE